MKVPRIAVRTRGTAFFVGLALVLAVVSRAGAQTASRGVIEQLVQSAAASIRERYTRSLGRVGERRRDRVLVILRQLPPPPGTVLEVVRAAKNKQPEHVVARLEVLHTEAGLTECREQDRVGRSHAEAGDSVRRPLGETRLLLAPCVALIDLAPEIPDVLGEKLRTEIRGSEVFDVLDAPEVERRAQVAYTAGIAADFVVHQTNADEVLFPVLLQTPGKMVLNLEYYSVERGRATDIDVVSAPLDDLMRAWLRAGRLRQAAPPGYRRLPALAFPWHVTGLGAAPDGDLVALDPDSVHVLRVDFPGLRPRWAAALGPRQRPRRESTSLVLAGRDLQAAGVESFNLGDGVHLLSDERRPLFLAWPKANAANATPQLRPAPADLEPTLERVWLALRPQGRRQDARWWPAPGQTPTIFVACLGDLDQDNKTDLVWTDAAGMLQIKLAAQRAARSFPGFGDAKAVQTQLAAGGRPTLWLTEPVGSGEPDRLHRAELSGDDLQVVWSSDAYEGTIPALASLDLNHDGAADLVVAESIEDGTRLHAFVAIIGERTAPRAPSPESGGRR